MMNHISFDALSVHDMSSGHLCLNLSERIVWDNFPAFADQFLKEVKGGVIQKNDAPDVRLWKVRIGKCILSLVFDDYPLMTSLESSDKEGDELIKELYRKLRPRDAFRN